MDKRKGLSEPKSAAYRAPPPLVSAKWASRTEYAKSKQFDEDLLVSFVEAATRAGRKPEP
jgi:hypothetical protein